jgi:hypothetical protein
VFHVSSYPGEGVAIFILAQLIFCVLSEGVSHDDDASATVDSSQASDPFVFVFTMKSLIFDFGCPEIFYSWAKVSGCQTHMHL